LRGAAVLLVVLFHAGLKVPGGFTGVDVFFVISGFVIGGVLLAELEQTNSVDFGRFYGRRVRRLLPALGMMVTIVALSGVLLAPVASHRADGITGILAALFSANAYLIHNGVGYFASDEALNPFLHTWTLAVEEQFYVVFPAVLVLSWILARRHRPHSSRKSAALVVGLISLLSFALALTLSSGPVGGLLAHERFAFYGSPTRAWEFGAGTLLVLASPSLARLPAISAVFLRGLGWGAVLVGAIGIDGSSNYPGVTTLLPVGGACAILAAGTIDKRATARRIGLRPLVWLGDRSYSWYLWHWPFIVFAVALWPAQPLVAATGAAALSLIPAVLSFRYVENPIRSNSGLAGRRVLALAAVCVSVPVLACLGFIGLSDAISSQPALAAWQASQAMHLDHVRGCDSGKPFGLQPPRCTWTVRNARGQLVLIGDSYAGQVTEAVVRAGNIEGLDVTVATYPACPFLDVRVYELSPNERQCRRYYERGLRALLRTRPNLVVTAFRADHYTQDPQIRVAVGKEGWGSISSTAKESAMARALTSTLQQLNSEAIPVLVVDPVPWYPRAMGACATVRILTESCPSTIARSVEDGLLARQTRIDRLAIREAALSYRLKSRRSLM
jgi:peptidoglycan/LPS O-acetylase OafA/YrhL